MRAGGMVRFVAQCVSTLCQTDLLNKQFAWMLNVHISSLWRLADYILVK
jgi:hypothetical protein